MIFGLLFDLEVASMSKRPFSESWRRLRCMRKGHVIKGSKLIDKMVSERHPHTDKEFIYSVTLRECTCGLIFTSVGLAFRDPPWEPEKIGEISD